MTLQRPLGHQQIYLVLQERIERGDYAPGSWLPAERALAEEFGMDRSAIRRVLRQLEDRGLIVREAGRRPWVRTVSVSNQSRREQTQLQTIAAILPQHPIYAASQAILHGINATLVSTEAPFRLQIIDTHGGSELRETSLEKQALDSVAREHIAGVVIWHMGGQETLPLLVELENQGTPIVFVDRFPQGLTCDFVGGDNQSGIEEAVSYLRQLGHQRIAHLTTDEHTTAVLERLAAYTEAMRTADSAFCSEWVFQIAHDKTMEIGPAYDYFFRLDEPPTAVLAMNDALAYHFIGECQRRGKRVPEDISVIGYDDLERHSPRPALLTTLHQPFGKMGRRAAELLLRRLSEPNTSPGPRQHIFLPTPLIKRLTCQPL